MSYNLIQVYIWNDTKRLWALLWVPWYCNYYPLTATDVLTPTAVIVSSKQTVCQMYIITTKINLTSSSIFCCLINFTQQLSLNDIKTTFIPHESEKSKWRGFTEIGDVGKDQLWMNNPRSFKLHFFFFLFSFKTESLTYSTGKALFPAQEPLDHATICHDAQADIVPHLQQCSSFTLFFFSFSDFNMTNFLEYYKLSTFFRWK